MRMPIGSTATDAYPSPISEWPYSTAHVSLSGCDALSGHLAPETLSSHYTGGWESFPPSPRAGAAQVPDDRRPNRASVEFSAGTLPVRPKSREILPPRGVGRQASTVAGFDPPRRRLLAIPIRVDQSVLTLACSGYSPPAGKARVSAAYQVFRRDTPVTGATGAGQG